MNQRPLYNVVDGYGRTVNLHPLHNYQDAERMAYEQYQRTFATLTSRYNKAGYGRSGSRAASEWQRAIGCSPCHAHALAKCNVVRVEVK